MIDVTDYKTLTDEALFDLLFTAADALPRAAADEILARGDRLSGRLLELLGSEADFEDDTDRGWSVVHATLLVGALKPPGSLQRMLEAMRLALKFDVEAVMHSLPPIFASFGPAATAELIAHMDALDESAYGTATLADALNLIGRRCPETRLPIATALRRVCADPQRDPTVRELVALNLLEFAEPTDRPLLEELAGEMYAASDIDAALNGVDRGERPGDYVWMDFYDPDQIAARQERWVKYVDQVDRQHDDCDCCREHGHGHEHAHDHGTACATGPHSPALGMPGSEPKHQPPPPPLRREHVPGRNEPCTCGSGKKYKKCCGK